MITAAEAKSRTYSSFLESDIAKFDSKVEGAIRQDRNACGIILYANDNYDKIINIKELLKTIMANGYVVTKPKDERDIYFVFWDFDSEFNRHKEFVDVLKEEDL